MHLELTWLTSLKGIKRGAGGKKRWNVIKTYISFSVRGLYIVSDSYSSEPRDLQVDTLDTAYVTAEYHRGQPVDSHIEPISPADNTSQVR